MAKVALPIVGGAYKLPQTLLSAQTCLNMYPQTVEIPNGDYVSALISTAGLTLYKTTGNIVRGMLALSNGSALIVDGNSLLIMGIGLDPVLIGTIGGTATCSIAENKIQAVIVTGSLGYVLDLSNNALTQIVDPAFYGADFVEFLDGRFYFNKPNTGQIYWTGLYDATFNALNFATVEGSPDNLKAIISKQLELWLIGETSTEVWFPTGDKDLPIQRQGGSYIPYGISAIRSVSRMGTALIWLAKSEFGNNQVIMVQGYQAQPISNHALDAEFGTYSRVDDAIAYVYQQEGHSFYVINFPSANKTWCYDQTTQLWHERAYLGTDGQLDRHLGQHHCFWNGLHLVSDYSKPNLYIYDVNNVTDNGREIYRQRSCPMVQQGNNFIRFDALELTFSTGFVSNSSIDPQCTLDWSDDGGSTWSHPYMQSMGKLGQYAKRVIFRRLGTSRQRVFRVTFTSAAPFTLIDSQLTATAANA